MPPFLVTLITISAAAVHRTQSETIRNPPERPIALAVAAVAHVSLNRTVFGRRSSPLGMNRRTAEIFGAPVRRIVVPVVTISAPCATVGRDPMLHQAGGRDADGAGGGLAARPAARRAA